MQNILKLTPGDQRRSSHIPHIRALPTNALIYYQNTTLLTLYVIPKGFNLYKVILLEYIWYILAASSTK